MSHPFSIRAWVAIAVSLCPAPAIAKPRKPDAARNGCEKDYADARKLEASGQLAAAEKLLKRCAVSSCGELVEQQCTARHAVVDSDTPSVVPVAADDKGEPVVDVEVTMDSQPLIDHLDGRAIRIDPGLHQFTFKRAGNGQVAQRSVLVAQGQRNRRIEVILSARRANPPATAARAETRRAEPATPTAAEPPKADLGAAPQPAPPTPAPRPREDGHGSLLPSYLMLATGVAGLGSFGVLTYWGRRDNDKLADCSPNCPAASVDHIRNLYLAANISLGVGAAALLTGVWLRWRNHATYQVDLQVKNGGAIAHGLEAILKPDPRRSPMRKHPLLVLALCTPFVTSCLQELDDRAASGSGPPDLALDTPPIELPGGATTNDPCVVTRMQALAIRQKNCAACHGGAGPGARQGQPPFDFVLDDARLTTERSSNVPDVNDASKGMPFVAPGKPDNSRIYRRIVSGEMPPMLPIGVEQPPRPSVSDMSILQAWIATCLK